MNVYPSPEYQKDNLQQVLESLSLADLSKQNLKTLYDDLRQLLTTQLAQQQYDQQIEVISINQKDELDQLNQMIETVKIKIRKEKQLNRKIDMQMQLHGLKQQRLLCQESGHKSTNKFDFQFKLLNLIFGGRSFSPVQILKTL
ncbi:DUF4391 domain-containing protein [Latilactobacillus sakei]|nr:DUF4391 domain-containing protein [Latilactobacillus sakei]UNC22271.1 DUF4391 domain-containing protein [Latilactobacillus sakei]UNC24115.1 DUF4391 domain-containing protein [Latilactobacillus sakei]